MDLSFKFVLNPNNQFPILLLLLLSDNGAQEEGGKLP